MQPLMLYFNAKHFISFHHPDLKLSLKKCQHIALRLFHWSSNDCCMRWNQFRFFASPLSVTAAAAAAHLAWQLHKSR